MEETAQSQSRRGAVVMIRYYTGDEIHGFMFGDYRSDKPRWIDAKDHEAEVARLRKALTRIEAQTANHGTMTIREASDIARTALNSNTVQS